MDWIDGLKNKLFGGAVQKTGQLHHALLKRSVAFEVKHSNWLNSGLYRELSQELNALLEQEVRHGDTTELHLLRNAKATGMQLERPAHWPADCLHHLMDAFREQIIALGYRTQMSDLRISMSGEYRERHYLKPIWSSDIPGAAIDQRYGNILIEVWGTENEAEHLKVLATVYHDRLYSPAASGMELLSLLTAGRGLPLS